MADRTFQLGSRVTFDEISKSTGIHRTTLSKLANQKGYNTTTDNLDKICVFFDCPIEKLIEYVKLIEE